MRQKPWFEEKDERKLTFTLDSLDDLDPFALQTEVHEDVAQVRRAGLATLLALSCVTQALRWHAERTPGQVLEERETMMRRLEADASALWCEPPIDSTFAQGAFNTCRRDGSCSRWLKHASHKVKKLAQTVNGPMLEKLARRVGFEDVGCVDMFRTGWLLQSCAALLAPWF